MTKTAVLLTGAICLTMACTAAAQGHPSPPTLKFSRPAAATAGAGDTYICTLDYVIGNHYLWADVGIWDPYGRRVATRIGAAFGILHVEASFTMAREHPTGVYTCASVVQVSPPGGFPWYEYPVPDTLFIENIPCGSCWAQVAFQRGHIINYRFDPSFPPPFQPQFRTAVDAWNAISYQWSETIGFPLCQ